jgi:hypothetical protein
VQLPMAGHGDSRPFYTAVSNPVYCGIRFGSMGRCRSIVEVPDAIDQYRRVWDMIGASQQPVSLEDFLAANSREPCLPAT